MCSAEKFDEFSWEDSLVFSVVNAVALEKIEDVDFGGLRSLVLNQS